MTLFQSRLGPLEPLKFFFFPTFGRNFKSPTNNITNQKTVVACLACHHNTHVAAADAPSLSDEAAAGRVALAAAKTLSLLCAHVNGWQIRRERNFQAMDAAAAVAPRRRKSQQLSHVIESQPDAFLYLFQCGWKQLESVFPCRRAFSFRNAAKDAIGIRVGSHDWLLLIAGGRFCAMVAHRLLCGPGGRAIDAPLKRWTAILSRRHFFVEATLPCVATLAGHSSAVFSVAFHPSEQVLATCSLDKTAKVWRMSADFTAATCVATLAGHSGNIFPSRFIQVSRSWRPAAWTVPPNCGACLPTALE
jgi:hypothetical protein